MKVNQLLVVLLLGISTAIPAFGQSETSPAQEVYKSIDLVQVPGKDAWYVSYLNTGDEKVTVKILDASGNRVFYQRIDREDLATKSFVLSKLPLGTYTFDINNGAYQETIEPFELAAQKALEVNILPAATRQKFELSVNDESVQELSVKIFDESNVLLFDDSVALDDQQKRRFDLQRVRADQLVFVISDGERQTTETIDLR